MSKSKLQVAAQKRNSAKGRIKGLRNNMRGMLSDNNTPLTAEEKGVLTQSEKALDEILTQWDQQWEKLKTKI